jgi:hypothetical protein
MQTDGFCIPSGAEVIKKGIGKSPDIGRENQGLPEGYLRIMSHVLCERQGR